MAEKKQAVVVDMFGGQGTPAVDRTREYKDLGQLYAAGFVHALEADEDLVLLTHEAPQGAETASYRELYRLLEQAGFTLQELKNGTPVPLEVEA